MREDEDNSKRPRGSNKKGMNYAAFLLLGFSSGVLCAPEIVAPLLGNLLFSDDPASGGIFFFICGGFAGPIFIFSIIGCVHY